MLDLVITAAALMAATPAIDQSGAPDTASRPAAAHGKTTVKTAGHPKPRRTPTTSTPPRDAAGVVPPGAPGTGNPTIPGTPATPR
jgi:hypothetical protein